MSSIWHQEKSTMWALIILRNKFIKSVTQLLKICVYICYLIHRITEATLLIILKEMKKNWKKWLRRKKQKNLRLNVSQWTDLPEDANLHLSVTLTLCLFHTLFLKSLWLSYTLLFQALQVNQRSHTVSVSWYAFKPPPFSFSIWEPYQNLHCHGK